MSASVMFVGFSGGVNSFTEQRVKTKSHEEREKKKKVYSSTDSRAHIHTLYHTHSSAQQVF